uniref:CHD3-type chromatin-remodeling factor PICKLE n=1 Tax=Anthurium amnicola TaxID=1678845 RepID=A0A1D1YBA8_9ARAE
MSSLVERLRTRTEKKRVYTEDFSDDDDIYVRGGRRPTPAPAPEKYERVVREDARDDSCRACGESGDLLNCETCTYAYHFKCILPPLKEAPTDSWKCPECVSPLNEIEKILDCEMRPIVGDTDASNLASKQKFVKQYLVKWKGMSYLHCTWVPEKDFVKAFKEYPRLKTKINTFKRQMDSITNSEDEWIAIRPEWTTVDRILASRKKGDEREYFVKWKELPYDECSWEMESDISAFQPQIDKYSMIQSRASKTSTKHKIFSRNPKDLKQKQEFQQYEHSPKFLSGGTLHPYQLEGLNFLRYSWSKNTHVILADEMGLGKTIQSIAFLASLLEENPSPHLIVAPLSTLRNWEREFATWAPQMNVVMYFGSAQARAVIREYEFFFPKEKMKKKKMKAAKDVNVKKKQRRAKFDVLLTSYEMINMDSASLKPVKWECVIVDEGHRLKNKDSKLFSTLKIFTSKHRVLLTGTPLQNNLDELFILMHFLDAGKFASLEDFQKEFTDINQEEQIARLHKMLAPHLLRRLKKDVMKELPPKKELILRVELSSKQKEYYKAILTRNYQILTRRGGAQISLINVVMELRKLCCHAYMMEGVEPEVEPEDPNEGLRKLLETSGKMQLLDKMMVKLKEQGHRVLIYSQFQHMLDLLEDYLNYKKWAYERIDGKISGAERQIRIDRFNAKNSTRFCFVLSTRAGGLGINLATADTVIIYDSDWNPHADLQAMARAHRLGQTNKVMIFRLITRGTIEERMMQMTKKKMILEHLVVGRLKTQTVNQVELDDIIRYGSKELFADENDEAGKSRQIHYDDAAIERLLNREQFEGEGSSIDDEEEDDFLKAFKVANFEYVDEAEVAAAKEEEARRQAMLNKAFDPNSERANYWDELLKDRYEIHQVHEFTSLGKGKRSRKQMAAAEEDDLAGLEDVSSEDEDYRFEDDLSDVDANTSGRRAHISKKKARLDNLEQLPLMEGEGKGFRVLGFNQGQRAAFVQILMRFGFGNFDWSEFVSRMKGKSLEEIKEYGTLFMSHIAEEITDSPTFSDGVPKEGLRIDDVLVRIATLQLTKEKVNLVSENPGTPLFSQDILSRFPALTTRTWKETHDLLLLRAVLKHGYAKWQAIVEDKDTGIADVVRQEQNLPFANGFVTGCAQTNGVPSTNGAIPSGTTDGQMQRSGSGNVSASLITDGTSDVSRGNQSFPDASMLYHIREVQRRMVEVIRKRFILLEKAIHTEEFLKENLGNAKPCEPAAVDIELEPTVVPGPNACDVHPQLLNGLPSLQPIALQEPAYDNNLDRLHMSRLYNEMCKTMEDNAYDSIQSQLGDNAAGTRLRKNFHTLEAMCEDVHRILTIQEQNFTNSKEPDRNINPPVEAEAHGNILPDVGVPSDAGDKPKIRADVESRAEVPESQSKKHATNLNVPSVHSEKDKKDPPIRNGTSDLSGLCKEPTCSSSNTGNEDANRASTEQASAGGSN